MFHATIRPDAERLLRVSGEVVPYDLQVLREHVLARCRRGARVEVRLPSRLHATLRAALADLDRRGIELIVQPETSSARFGSE
jgi:hypothetical protein